MTWTTNRKALTKGSNICTKGIYIQQIKQRLKLTHQYVRLIVAHQDVNLKWWSRNHYAAKQMCIRITQKLSPLNAIAFLSFLYSRYKNVTHYICYNCGVCDQINHVTSCSTFNLHMALRFKRKGIEHFYFHLKLFYLGLISVRNILNTHIHHTHYTLYSPQKVLGSILQFIRVINSWKENWKTDHSKCKIRIEYL